MLDYEGISYQVKYMPTGGNRFVVKLFFTEEDAIEFIKANRSNWQTYKMIKASYAVIDF